MKHLLSYYLSPEGFGWRTGRRMSRGLPVLCAGVIVGAGYLAGCGNPQALSPYPRPPSQPPLGTISDQYWSRQEYNAEASKNVFYQHEFKFQGERLNWAGEDHLKAIAAQMMRNPEFPVIIERSLTAPDPSAKYKYPVNPDPALDMRRREMIVELLTALGVPDASNRVVVSSALAPGITAQQAEQAFLRLGLSTSGNFGGFGSSFGGFGGFGGGLGAF